MAVLVYKSLHGDGLVEDCELVAAADRQLRSSDIATFVIPRIPTLDSAIGHSQLLDHGCGTAFRPAYDSLALPFSSSAGC